MAIVTYILRKDQKPTPEQIEEIREAAKHPVERDEDNPPMTEEEYNFYSGLMRKYKTNRVTKEMVLKELADNPAIFQAKKLKR